MVLDYILLKDKLTDEYAEAFDKVILYTEVRNMQGKTEQEMMMNLLDMLITAQDENKPVEKIIGKDVEKFCKSYFEDYDIKTRLTDEIPRRCYSTMWFIFVFEILELIFGMMEENAKLFEISSDISGYLFGLVIGIMIIAIDSIVIKPFIFKWKKMNSGMHEGLVFVFSVVMIVAGIGFFAEEEISIPVFPIVIVSGLYIVVYSSIRAVLRYKDHGTIWKGQKPFEESWWKKMGASVKIALPSEIVKDYEKKNRRRVKKGKKEITPEEFMEKIRKENEAVDRFYKIFMVILFLVIAIMAIIEMFTNNIEEGIIFAVVLCIFEIPALMLFKVASSGIKMKRDILDECERQGINIVEYANNIQKSTVS